VFLSHTRLRNRFAIRLAVGNLRTTERHVEGAWSLLRAEAARLAAQAPIGEAFTSRRSDA
jgi:aromatic-L-amino-acid decarboxylase